MSQAPDGVRGGSASSHERPTIRPTRRRRCGSYFWHTPSTRPTRPPCRHKMASRCPIGSRDNWETGRSRRPGEHVPGGDLSDDKWLMTVQKHDPRPWYCIDALVDDYVTIHEEGGDLKMLKSLKITRAIVVNIGIIAITLLALAEGAEATIVGGLGLVSLATYNGVEIADYGALVQALAEAGSQSTAGSSSESNDEGGNQ